MGPNLNFDMFAATPKYLNENIWFSSTQPGITSQTGPNGTTIYSVDRGTEVYQPIVGNTYYAAATVRNTGDADSGPVTVYFFLCPLAFNPKLTAGKPLGGVKIGIIHHLDPPRFKPIDFSLFVPLGYPVPQTTTLGDNCLVGVLLEDVSKNDNIYVDANGSPKDDVGVNYNDRVIAQHNITVVAATGGLSGSLVSNSGSVNLYGSADRLASSVVLRAPDKIELDALRAHAALGPRAKLIQDVTLESTAGLFDSDPSAEKPPGDQGLKKLPVEMAVEGLEEGCARKIHWGVKLPDCGEGAEGLRAAFMLLEQISERGEVLGGVAVIATSRDLPARPRVREGQ